MNYFEGECPICGDENCQGQDVEIREIIKRMGKTLIGTCGDCRRAGPYGAGYIYCEKLHENRLPDFGCIHWKEKEK
jgi:hypothetical protein